MRRQHPLISLTGFALTILFLLGLAASIWINGGQAFSPGKLSAFSIKGVTLSGFTSHADFENQCNRCHAPLTATQDALCLGCHASVREQVEKSDGYHSQIEQVERCAGCHTDHQGREFNPGQAALKYFEHDQTDFSLSKHQLDYAGAPIICTSCHLAEGWYSDPTAEQCTACHGQQSTTFMLEHIQDYGPDCLSCHDGRDSMLDFDHSTTSFPLKGKHRAVTCNECHAERGVQEEAMGWPASFQGISKDCAACHAEPQAHQGVFENQCNNCHTEEGWLPARWQGATFEHNTSTGFSLAHHRNGFDAQPLNCTSCHATQFTSFDLQLCTNCHSAGDERRADYLRGHVEQYGVACLDCHDGVDRMVNFDHQQVFPLDGVHGEIECTSCHKDRNYHGTPKECVQCHAEPAIHAGIFGVSCQDCHTAQAWVPAQLQVHKFPLDHGEQGEVACTLCHVSTYTSYTCYGCHEHQPDKIQAEHQEENIKLEDLADCTSCHAEGE